MAKGNFKIDTRTEKDIVLKTRLTAEERRQKQAKLENKFWYEDVNHGILGIAPDFEERNRYKGQ